uniref:Uncharacterized protein n=1 Tax=Arundo donax TaxID=35708 RepID=A0A0A9C8L9_ARUDO
MYLRPNNQQKEEISPSISAPRPSSKSGEGEGGGASWREVGFGERRPGWLCPVAGGEVADGKPQ